jgi:hypothetical protein
MDAKQTTIEDLLNLLASYGGEIVSTASLSPQWIEQARVSNRLYVDENSLGFVWEPDIKRMPENDEELAFFEKYYPLPVEMPPELSNPEIFFKNVEKRILKERQQKEN